MAEATTPNAAVVGRTVTERALSKLWACLRSENVDGGGDALRIVEARLVELTGQRDAAEQLYAAEAARVTQLEALINTPGTEHFLKSVETEAAHQVARWGSEHDAGKKPSDWFWLLGYLSGKALASALKGDIEKAKHHTISSAA
ncbi:MAG TPA: hypothetical protein VGJ91_23400, partial [Polyangiaceae bacterium]